MDEPTEQANKRPHVNNQAEAAEEGFKDGETPHRLASPQERGKPTCHCKPCSPFLIVTIATRNPAVSASVPTRKTLPRPSLSLDSGDEEENSHTGGLLNFSLLDGRPLTG